MEQILYVKFFKIEKDVNDKVMTRSNMLLYNLKTMFYSI